MILLRHIPTLLVVALLPLFYSNPAALNFNLDLLAQHEELRPCLEWIAKHDVQFLRSSRWAAVYRGNVILHPLFVSRGPYTASIIVQEIAHLQGWQHPEADYIHLRAARILKVDAGHMALLEKRATGLSMQPCVVPPASAQ